MEDIQRSIFDIVRDFLRVYYRLLKGRPMRKPKRRPEKPARYTAPWLHPKAHRNRALNKLKQHDAICCTHLKRLLKRLNINA